MFVDPDGAQAFFLPSTWDFIFNSIASFNFDNWLTNKAGIAEEFTNKYYNYENMDPAKFSFNIKNNNEVSHSISYSRNDFGLPYHFGVTTDLNSLYISGGIDLNLAIPLCPYITDDFSYALNFEENPSTTFTKSFSYGVGVGSQYTYNINSWYDALNPLAGRDNSFSSRSLVFSNSIWVGISLDFNLKLK